MKQTIFINIPADTATYRECKYTKMFSINDFIKHDTAPRRIPKLFSSYFLGKLIRDRTQLSGVWRPNSTKLIEFVELIDVMQHCSVGSQT